MATCKGCGAVLQNENPKLIGYTPKEDSDYCQRCFRLMHYDDLTVSMRTGIDPDTVINRVSKMDCLILWVVDLFDFEAGMIPGLNRKFIGKDILMVCTKRDILPETLSQEKAARFVFSRLKEQGLAIKGLIFTSKLSREGVDQVKDAIASYAKGRPVAVVGRANAGKSTLINSLMGESILTMSRYPGTTLDFNELEIDGQKYIDTPGIEIEGSILQMVKEEDLKAVLPSRTIKPQIYQLRGNQSFAIGGLARIDLYGCDEASCVFYISERLLIHRGKAENAAALWQKHAGVDFKPFIEKKKFKKYTNKKEWNKVDCVIDGLGWACVSGQVKSMDVYVPEGVNVTFRKAMM